MMEDYRPEKMKDSNVKMWLILKKETLVHQNLQIISQST